MDSIQVSLTNWHEKLVSKQRPFFHQRFRFSTDIETFLSIFLGLFSRVFFSYLEKNYEQ